MELVSGRFRGCVSLLVAVVIIKSNLNREAAAGSPLRADAACSTQGVSGHQGCTPPAESNLEKAGTILAHTWRELSTAVGRHRGSKDSCDGDSRSGRWLVTWRPQSGSRESAECLDLAHFCSEPQPKGRCHPPPVCGRLR